MKILFLSVPTGGGHHQAAKAMESYFAGRNDVECRMLDIAENVNSTLAEAVSKGYILSTTITPKIYGSLYDLLDMRTSPQGEVSKTIKFLSTAFRKKLYAYIEAFRPDVIVSTHLFATITINRIATHHPITAKLISIVTDFTIHPMWEQAKSDYYITASELLSYQAIKKWGSVENVLPLGIPISPKFSKKVPPAEARKALGIADKFTVLVMMGSMGYGTHTLEMLKKLDSLEEDFQILVVCGSNDKLKAKVDKMKRRKDILTYGFMNNVDVLMDACNCIITKPGGLSTSEALAKRLPILMLDPIPGQEDRNKEFMLNNGIALNLSETFGADEAVYQLIHYPFKAMRLSENTQHFAKPHAARDLGEFMLEICNREE